MRGRKPTPIAAQIAAGDPRKHGVGKLREKLANEPKATRGLLPPPEQITERAADIYRFWADELKDMDVDRRPDSILLEAAAVHAARGEFADVQVKLLGEVIDEPITSRETGEIIGHRMKKNPWVDVSNKAWMMAGRFCSEFPFSPVSRTRLAIERKDEEQDLAAILSAPRPVRHVVQ